MAVIAWGSYCAKGVDLKERRKKIREIEGFGYGIVDGLNKPFPALSLASYLLLSAFTTSYSLLCSLPFRLP